MMRLLLSGVAFLSVKALVYFLNDSREERHIMANEQKLKYLELIQAAIARMANNSFMFKGWAVTIASALAAFGAVASNTGLVDIAIITTLLFWGLDGYYLWLERGFIKLHEEAAKLRDTDPVSFNMAVNKQRAFRRWLGTCFRWHLMLFYGAILATELIGIYYITEVAK